MRFFLIVSLHLLSYLKSFTMWYEMRDLMKKVELLAPAGSMESLIAAIQNGCDAIYLGGSSFGARAFADNFTNDKMIEAITYAHGYGVKVYVTMNTLIMEDEMDDAVAYARFLYEHEVDALIIQDLGLFDVLHQCFPSLELHASTQMHIHNEQGIQIIAQAGAKRVVVPRELSVERIAQLAKMQVDLEVFVQGALCVSYSGQCLMSSKKLSRSGNRGECAQMCRMRYQLKKEVAGSISTMKQDGEYLLSPKDLNTLSLVPKLIASGIASFKIEGRMKRPAYVALMVSLYRKAIDAYYNKQEFKEMDYDIQMRKVFNREFTQGHLFHQKGKALMNFYRPNHMGIPLGIVQVATRERITLKLQDDLAQGDGIRFLDEREDHGCMVNRLYKNNKLVNSAKRGDVVEIEYHGYVKKHSHVVKTSDKLQLEVLTQSYEKEQRFVSIDMQATLKKGYPLSIHVQDKEGFSCTLQSEELVEEANHTPLDEQRFAKQLQKCGGTIFTIDSLHIDMDYDATISIKVINQLRRDILEILMQKRTSRTYEKTYGTYQREIKLAQAHDSYVVVHTQNQFDAVAKLHINHIYIANRNLYDALRKQHIDVGYYGPRISDTSYPEGKVMFSELGGITRDGIAEHFMNITNSYSAAFLFAQGVQGIILSNEVDTHMQQSVKDAFRARYGCPGNFITYAYGREELMVSEYCAINACEKDNNKHACALCKGSTRYYLEDVQGNMYPLYGDESCRMHILDNEPIINMKDSSSIVLVFHMEDTQEVRSITKEALAMF